MQRKYSTVECKRTALWCRPSSELLGESDEKPFRAADVAEPIRVFILNNFAHELRAALAEPLERLVDVVHGEHDYSDNGPWGNCSEAVSTRAVPFSRGPGTFR